MQLYTRPISCICVTFLICAISNVSSNGLLENRQSHIGCICYGRGLYQKQLRIPDTIPASEAMVEWWWPK